MAILTATVVVPSEENLPYYLISASLLREPVRKTLLIKCFTSKFHTGNNLQPLLPDQEVTSQDALSVCATLLRKISQVRLG